MVEELGFSLSPGTSTLAAIRKEKVRIPNIAFQSAKITKWLPLEDMTDMKMKRKTPSNFKEIIL